ncbi:TolC family protein [Dehalobacter sp.]|uniref:TolC family protein n=1 Tax=Dehalobacter sp. TaxID=1962289 RepID=UPI00258E4179|nr:TolC family protein [Dehalobacter sp.]MCG1024855.1 TolC family protein [Dehalobacter sp.]
MKKRLLSVLALALTASIILTVQNSLAFGSSLQTDSETSTPSSTVTDSTTTEPTSSGKNAQLVSQPSDSSRLDLSIEDALKLVETGNSDLKLTDSKIVIYDKQNQQALARHNSIAVADEDSKKDRDLNYKRSQWTIDNAKHDREKQLKSLKVQITNEYNNILTLQQQAANIKTLENNLEETIKQINLQIKLGLKIPSEITTYNAQKSKLEASHEAVENSINSSMITLKKDLGIDINTNVVLTSELVKYLPFDDTGLDLKIKKTAQTNYDIQKYKQDIEITQIEYDIDRYYEDSNADSLEISIEDKKATLDSLPVTKEVELRTAYNSLKSLQNTVEADKLTVEADKINLDNMQKLYNAGKASKLDIISLKNILLIDQNTLQQDINTYMTAAANFQNSLDD